MDAESRVSSDVLLRVVAAVGGLLASIPQEPGRTPSQPRSQVTLVTAGSVLMAPSGSTRRTLPFPRVGDVRGANRGSTATAYGSLSSPFAGDRFPLRRLTSAALRRGGRTRTRRRSVALVSRRRGCAGCWWPPHRVGTPARRGDRLCRLGRSLPRGTRPTPPSRTVTTTGTGVGGGAQLPASRAVAGGAGGSATVFSAASGR